MAHTPEEIKKSVRLYIKIGLALIFLSGLTVALSYYEMPTHGMNIIAGMFLATCKALLVALVFMHLSNEKPLIYKVLIFTGVFVTALFLLFYFHNVEGLHFDGFYSPNEPIQPN